MLTELLAACDDVEMLEEMIGAKRDESGELEEPLKRKKSKLL